MKIFNVIKMGIFVRLLPDWNDINPEGPECQTREKNQQNCAFEFSYSHLRQSVRKLANFCVRHFLSNCSKLPWVCSNPNSPFWCFSKSRTSSNLILSLSLGSTITPVFCCLSNSAARSEEHTSELQSQSNLVCRLL